MADSYQQEPCSSSGKLTSPKLPKYLTLRLKFLARWLANWIISYFLSNTTTYFSAVRDCFFKEVHLVRGGTQFEACHDRAEISSRNHRNIQKIFKNSLARIEKNIFHMSGDVVIKKNVICGRWQNIVGIKWKYFHLNKRESQRRIFRGKERLWRQEEGWPWIMHETALELRTKNLLKVLRIMTGLVKSMQWNQPL